jgi:hypothetical protein
MLDILAERIHDNRFPRLVRNMLQAGYLRTGNGMPRIVELYSGVASPVSNFHLHRLDTFVGRF